MKKCKNDACELMITDKRTYCSFTCRNIYVNKHLRDYKKNGNALSVKTRENYEKAPKKCLNKECNKIIPYKKRVNNYCDSSCQARQTNLGRKLSNLTKIKIRKKYYERNSNLNSNINCKFCGEKIPKNIRKLYCSDYCRINFLRKNSSAYNQYKADAKFNFNLADYPNEFDFKLIEQYGWYKAKNNGNNLGGVSRDHILSINEGFKKNIDPKIISHPANCQLMRHCDNISKNKKSNITIEDLLKKIQDWEEKYPTNKNYE